MKFIKDLFIRQVAIIGLLVIGFLCVIYLNWAVAFVVCAFSGIAVFVLGFWRKSFAWLVMGLSLLVFCAFLPSLDEVWFFGSKEMLVLNKVEDLSSKTNFSGVFIPDSMVLKDKYGIAVYETREYFSSQIDSYNYNYVAAAPIVAAGDPDTAYAWATCDLGYYSYLMPVSERDTQINHQVADCQAEWSKPYNAGLFVRDDGEHYGAAVDNFLLDNKIAVKGGQNLFLEWMESPQEYIDNNKKELFFLIFGLNLAVLIGSVLDPAFQWAFSRLVKTVDKTVNK